MKSTAPCQRFFSWLPPTPKIPAAREKNLWYPGFSEVFYEFIFGETVPQVVCEVGVWG